MTSDTIPISPTAKTTLLELAAFFGRPAGEVLETALREYRRRLMVEGVTEIEGIDPADIWAASAEADAGLLTDHATVMAELRARP